jgi:hypothetical protein
LEEQFLSCYYNETNCFLTSKTIQGKTASSGNWKGGMEQMMPLFQLTFNEKKGKILSLPMVLQHLMRNVDQEPVKRFLISIDDAFAKEEYRFPYWDKWAEGACSPQEIGHLLMLKSHEPTITNKKKNCTDAHMMVALGIHDFDSDEEQLTSAPPTPATISNKKRVASDSPLSAENTNAMLAQAGDMLTTPGRTTGRKRSTPNRFGFVDGPSIEPDLDMDDKVPYKRRKISGQKKQPDVDATATVVVNQESEPVEVEAEEIKDEIPKNPPQMTDPDIFLTSDEDEKKDNSKEDDDEEDKKEDEEES